MEKKYKLTEETININGRTLYRIEALKDFSNVRKGDKGGFIENEENLSQSDNCWVYDDAKVYGNAKVIDNATVESSAKIFDNAIISGNAKVYGRAKVYGNAKVCGNSAVCDYVELYGDAKIYENAFVCGFTEVYEDAIIYGNAEVYEDVVVRGYARVNGVAEICDNAVITSDLDYIVFKNWWSNGRYFTWTRSNDMWKAGCFYGTGKELIEKAYKDSELSGREYERVVKYVESILKNNSADALCED